MTMVLTISSNAYVLDDAADAETVMQDIETAVQRGGGFVKLPLVSHSPISVLIAPATSVIVQEAPPEEVAESDVIRAPLTYLDDFGL